MPKFHLVPLIHAHQPIGNFDEVIERTYQRSYLPFIECVGRHPHVRLGLHFSGSLLEWLKEKHPEYVERIGGMVSRKQVEIVGGGFYEPILIAIPREDQMEQIRRLTCFIEENFGTRPNGAWLAERVWEPQLPAVLKDSGIEYTLVDDSHFLTAGREVPELFGYYIAEEHGNTIKIIPGLKDLRYLLPFGSVEDSIAFLRRCAGDHPGAMASTGDDMEKFGGWPHTYEHCYRDGWLDRFFAALGSNQDWLETMPPGEALALRSPLGRVDLPTASYTEMMEWVLPTSVRQKFHSLLEEFSGRPDVTRFLRGGFWRGFFSKYAEANLLHKKMLRVSKKLKKFKPKSQKKNTKASVRGSEAITHLLRSQCNDAYWHGIFGGLYAPHLRSQLWRELVRAEAAADSLRHGGKTYQGVARLDFDSDGKEEIEITSLQFAAVIKPSDGGTVGVLDFRPSGVTLINSLQRRVEAYHSRLQQAGKADGRVASIHDQTLSKEPGLEKRLKYDRWARNSFRLLLFGPGKSHSDYEALQLEESAIFAGGNYKVNRVNASEIKLSAEAPMRHVVEGAGPECMLTLTKNLKFENTKQGFAVDCRVELIPKDSQPSPPASETHGNFTAGLEIVINLLAANAPDRYIEFSGNRKPLEWSGIVEGSSARFADEWQDVSVEIEAPGASQLWISPIETVSESEEGFERVYQGSQILAVWNIKPGLVAPWSAEAVLRVSPARSV